MTAHDIDHVMAMHGQAKEEAEQPPNEADFSAITDTDRINWLQANEQTAWRACHDEWRETTATLPRREKIEVFDGWVVMEGAAPDLDIRGAIDFAIRFPEAAPNEVSDRP